MGCILSKKSPPLSNGTSCAVKSPDPNKPVPENPPIEKEAKPITKIPENLHQEEENTTTKKEDSVRRSHEKSEESPAVVEKSIESVVMSSSCKRDEVDAILIQCGKMSRSNSAAKTRRYSGSKRSFDFDQNERIQVGDVEEQEIERKTHRNRVNDSPRERRRRTPSREREDSKNYRSGSRERGNYGGGRRVSRSPGKRLEINPNSNPNSSGISVNSRKLVTVPATEPSIKRITVKRNIGEACRTAASPRSKSPVPPQPSLSRSNSRKAEQSPYRRNPLGEIDQNTNCNKKMIHESGKLNPRKTIRASSPQVISRSRSLRKSRDFDFSPETLLLLTNEENKNSNNYTALLLKDIKSFHGKSNNVDDDDDPSISFNLLPSCVTKACSIVEAVADLNSTSSDSSQFRFTSRAKKADLMEPSFEKYVTVKRGGSLEGPQESSGSNNLT